MGRSRSGSWGGDMSALDDLKTKWLDDKLTRFDFTNACEDLLRSGAGFDDLYKAATVDRQIVKIWVRQMNTICFEDPKNMITLFAGCSRGPVDHPPFQPLPDDLKGALVEWLTRKGLVLPKETIAGG